MKTENIYFQQVPKSANDDLKHHFSMQKKVADELRLKFQSDEQTLDFLSLICVDGIADCFKCDNITFSYDSVISEIRDNVRTNSDLFNLFAEIVREAESISGKPILSLQELGKLFPAYSPF